MIPTKVKDLLPSMLTVMRSEGTITVSLNSKAANSWHGPVRGKTVRCRVVDILEKKQQVYILVYPLKGEDGDRLSLGEGTLVTRIDA
jgi:hypothetical protein